MAISDLDVKQQFNGDGANDTFAIPFAMVFDDSVEVKVYVGDTLQVEGALQDYTLTGAPDVNSFHVNVVFNSGSIPATGTNNVTLIRVLALTQALDLVAAGTVNLQTLETHLDGLLAKIQQLNERLDRAPVLKNTTTVDPVVMPDALAGYWPAWDSAGTALENVTGLAGSINPITYTSEAISAGGIIDSVIIAMQYRPVSGSGAARTAATAPFGTAKTWGAGTIIILRGDDDTNTLTIGHNDIQYGSILNGSMVLGLNDILALIYDSNTERWIELWRNN